MEPILPTPSNLEGQAASPNIQPLPPVPGVESAPNVAPERGHEGTLAPQSGVVQVPPTPVAPIAAAPVADPVQVVTAPTTDSPQIADDVDVIEKEWVEKAKKIVSDTKADPYQQEKQVSKLQADYLMKRYNKQLKTSE